ncbi:MAG TPA: error-prone DNA polymerase, partial [Acidimicrobiaceae bacterium]|nr:error-prone DNA polymerase [Acidimicrobiaceae bacterium]
MAFNNPNRSWQEMEALLSGRPLPGQRGKDGRAPGSASWNAGGDGPALGRKRQAYEPDTTRPLMRPDVGRTPYAELHCHSNFSFLDGASHPEALVEEAHRLGLEALALTDHNGFYGVVRFAEAARALGLPTVFGTEINLTAEGRRARTEADTQQQVNTGMVADSHAPDPHGRHLLVLADGPTGYARLARALSLGHLAGEKGAPQFTFDDIAEQVAGHGWVLTGCRKGAVPAALVGEGPGAAARELQRLVSAFGRDRVLVELWDHGHPLDSVRNDALAELAARHDVGVVATNNVHYAT